MSRENQPCCLFDSISTLYTCCVCQLFILKELDDDDDDDQHPYCGLQRQRHFEQCRRKFCTELLLSLLHLTSRKTCFVVYLDQHPFYIFKIVGLTSQKSFFGYCRPLRPEATAVAKSGENYAARQMVCLLGCL